MNAIKTKSDGISTFITNPPDGYEMAARHVAHWLYRFAAQLPIRQLLGGLPSILETYPKPKRYRFSVNNAAKATDEALRLNAHRSCLLDVLDAGDWAPASFREAAERLELGQS